MGDQASSAASSVTGEESTRFSDMSAMLTRIDNMREADEYCDFCIVATNRSGAVKRFNVHRVIVCATITYLGGLFRFHSDEENANEIKVNCDHDDMEAMLKFAYTQDTTRINKKNCFYLMTMGDYYGCRALIKHCADYFIKHLLTLDNVVEIFAAISLLNNVEMGKEFKILNVELWDFVLREFPRIADEILLDLSHEIFLKIVKSDRLNVKDERVVWEKIVKWLEHKPERFQFLDQSLFRSCRQGLLPESYFMDRVKRHRFVANNAELRPTVIDVMKFFSDLQSTSQLFSVQPTTPDFAMPRMPHEILFAIAGWSNGSPQSIIESYDTRADRWNRIGYEDPIGARAYHGTAELNGCLYCIGGFNGTDYFNTCTKFNPETLVWREIAPMHAKRCYVSVAVFENEIYALGGYDGQTRLRTVEKYCPTTNQWTFVEPMLMQRSDACASSTDNGIVIVGGFNGHECLNSAEMYDSTTKLWKLLPAMSSRRSGVSCIVTNNHVLYAVGGFNGTNRMNTGEKLDLKARRLEWQRIASMANPRSNFGLELIDDGSQIMAAGGYNGTVTINQCEVYNPERDEWLRATDMNVIRSALTLTLVRGLRNYTEFIYQEREKLLRERSEFLNGIDPSGEMMRFPPILQTVSLPQPLEFFDEGADLAHEDDVDFNFEDGLFDDLEQDEGGFENDEEEGEHRDVDDDDDIW